MDDLVKRRKEERSGTLVKDGFEALEPLSLVPYRKSSTVTTFRGLKTLEPEHKIYRKFIQFFKTHSAVQGAPRTNNAPAMPPSHREDLVKSGASRSKLRISHGKRGRHGNQSTGSSSPQISDASLTRSHQNYRRSLWAWIDHIPQSADDANIIFNVQQVFTLAEQYVNNFYVDRPSQQCQCECFLRHESFKNLPAGIQPSDVIHIVAHPTAVIKHSLVALLLSTISLTRNGPYCLLPSEFTALTRAVSGGRGFAADIHHFDAAFASHRVLLSYLYPAMVDDSSYVKARGDIFHTIVTIFEHTFSHWLDEQEPPERRLPNFYTLLQQTVNLGILLFSQPSTFEFNWEIRDPSPSGIDIPIAPRLLKISDENALEVHPNQHMVRIKRARTQMARPIQMLIGESSIGGQLNFNRQAPPTFGAEERVDIPRPPPKEKIAVELPAMTVSHVYQRDAEPVAHQGNGMVQGFNGDIDRRFNSAWHEMPVSSQSKSSPQRGHGEAQHLNRCSHDRGAADPEFSSRPGELADNTRTLSQGRQGQLMTDTKVRTQQDYPPSAYPTGQGSHPLRSGSMDRGRCNSESQRERGRSRSAHGAVPVRSLTWDNSDSTPGNEGRIDDTVPVSGVDQHSKMSSGSARTADHRDPAAAIPLSTGSTDHAYEVRPATHQGIGGNQAHNERTECQQSREQGIQCSLDYCNFPEAGQAQSSARRPKLGGSMRKSSEPKEHRISFWKRKAAKIR